VHGIQEFCSLYATLLFGLQLEARNIKYEESEELMDSMLLS
jgi:hypothetical protein